MKISDRNWRRQEWLLGSAVRWKSFKGEKKMRKNLVAKLAIILLGLAAAFCSKAEIIQTTGASGANSARQTIKSSPAADALEFGPGYGSQFAISSSEKAYVVGVYGLTWDQFKFRSGDNTYVFADDRLIDREKGSGTGAPDHQWCGTYADMVVIKSMASPAYSALEFNPTA